MTSEAAKGNERSHTLVGVRACRFIGRQQLHHNPQSPSDGHLHVSFRT